jgi:succinate dehydrogenase / fumarate reductase flavoprotein subunit
MNFETDVLIVGAGGAGMYAAIAAAREGARVLLLDKNMVGRGGATIMAQMTVAAALSEEEPDTWQAHLTDTLASGRGLCSEVLATTLCQHGAARMREMDYWGVGWARADGHIRQVMAPGHSKQRCCYVDFLSTGPAVAGALRKRVSREAGVTRLSNIAITDLIVHDGRVCGAVGLNVADGEALTIAAAATVIATGGLTRIYARSSASSNMSGEGYALAFRAGAELVDMEFVQFFPIGHLAPRLVGMDPIMWDPFRYKLGGRLLNGNMEEFIDRYGAEDSGHYTVTRDLATYAITREVAAGRGSPNGGVYLSFTHIAEADLRAAFGPVIDRLLANGIDLRTMVVEVAPIAHYHMGGLRVDACMRANLRGLYAAGEAVGGLSGANRLSGNAITEALVFGEIAGREAACAVRRHGHSNNHNGNDAASPSFDSAATLAVLAQVSGPNKSCADGPSISTLFGELRRLMWDKVGPFRNEAALTQALACIETMRGEDLHRIPRPAPGPYAQQLADWHELRAALDVARAVTTAALRRAESRGAHQRDDHPGLDEAFAQNQTLCLQGDEIISTFGAGDLGARWAA